MAYCHSLQYKYRNEPPDPLISYPQLTGQGCLDWEILVKAAIQEEKDASLPGAVDLCV